MVSFGSLCLNRLEKAKNLFVYTRAMSELLLHFKLNQLMFHGIEVIAFLNNTHGVDFVVSDNNKKWWLHRKKNDRWFKIKLEKLVIHRKWKWWVWIGGVLSEFIRNKLENNSWNFSVIFFQLLIVENSTIIHKIYSVFFQFFTVKQFTVISLPLLHGKINKFWHKTPMFIRHKCYEDLWKVHECNEEGERNHK